MALYLIPKGNAGRGFKYDVNFMTPEEIAAKKVADDEAATKVTADKEAADAAFEAEIAELPEEEQTAKRTERDAQNTDTTDEELDAELEKEEDIAAKAFKIREDKRKKDAEAAGGGDAEKPLTRKDLAEIQANASATANAGRAMEIAKTYATSPKEAELIFKKWQNRIFPEGLTLEQQLEETYAITHVKRITGERNEALRGLKNKDGINRSAASTHFVAPPVQTVKLKAGDLQAITGAGYVLNKAKAVYEKKLPDGSMLVYNPATKVRTRLPKA